MKDAGLSLVTADRISVAGRDQLSAIVVVVTYNGAPWIRACLESLIYGEGVDEIVVVDNASSDATLDICSSFADVHIIRNKANIGFGRANNIGISYALNKGADAVFIINQDTCVSADMLSALLNFQKAHRDFGILCPMQWNSDSSELDRKFLVSYLAPYAPTLLSDSIKGSLAEVYECKSAPAAAWLLSRECLLQVGGFDPLFFMYGEDDDLCARVRFHGYRIGIIPGANFVHLRGFSTKPRLSGLARIRQRASRLRSAHILSCKQLEGRFAVNAVRSHLRFAIDGPRALLLYFDAYYFAAAIRVCFGSLFELPTLYRHRAMCRSSGALWLDIKHD